MGTSHSAEEIAQSGKSFGGNLGDSYSWYVRGRALSRTLWVWLSAIALSKNCFTLVNLLLSHDSRFILYPTIFGFPFSSSSTQLSSLDIASSTNTSAALPFFFTVISTFSNARVRLVSFCKIKLWRLYLKKYKKRSPFYFTMQFNDYTYISFSSLPSTVLLVLLIFAVCFLFHDFIFRNKISLQCSCETRKKYETYNIILASRSHRYM